MYCLKCPALKVHINTGQTGERWWPKHYKEAYTAYFQTGNATGKFKTTRNIEAVLFALTRTISLDLALIFTHTATGLLIKACLQGSRANRASLSHKPEQEQQPVGSADHGNQPPSWLGNKHLRYPSIHCTKRIQNHRGRGFGMFPLVRAVKCGFWFVFCVG